jgi:hypothetical protein
LPEQKKGSLKRRPCKVSPVSKEEGRKEEVPRKAQAKDRRGG